MKKAIIFVSLTFLLSLVGVFYVNSYIINVGYYGFNDPLGFLSQNPVILIMELIVPIAMMIVLVRKYSLPSYFLSLPILFYCLFVFISLELMDQNYITSYYDSMSHITRGVYVSLTGHSNPAVDHYFDMQPGFFWFTSIISNSFGFSMASLIESSTIFLVKWTPIIAVIIYIPILYLFFKKQLNSSMLIALGILLTLSLSFLTFHYAAQTYGRALYWVILVLMFSSLSVRDKRITFLIGISSLSLFVIHQGLTLLLLLAAVALVFYPAPFRLISKDSRFFDKKQALLVISLIILWFTYLLFITQFQLNTLVNLVWSSFGSLFTEGAGGIVSDTSRASAIWQQIVYFKTAFIVFIV